MVIERERLVIEGEREVSCREGERSELWECACVYIACVCVYVACVSVYVACVSVCR